MREMKWVIMSLDPRHLDPVVELHMRAFSDFFLTFLGPRFLKEFYAAFFQEHSGIAFIAEEEHSGRVLGVVAGTLHPQGFFNRLLKRRWWAFCLASAAALLSRPRIAPRLFRALFYRGAPPPGPQRTLLSSIAVAPDAKRIGLGHALLDHWMRSVQNRGSIGCYLITDAISNDTANLFYQHSGWKSDCSFVTPEGRKMYRYVIDFRQS